MSKTVAGLADSLKGDDTFTFTVTSDKYSTTITLKDGESTTLSGIPAGTYTVTEGMPAAPKHVYETSVTGGTAVEGSTVSRSAEVGETPVTVAYTNTAVQTEVDWTEAELNATKTLTGRALKADEFAFTITDKDGKVVANGTNAAAAAGSAAAISFTEGKLTYDTIGIYEYTVTETIGDLGGVTYSDHSFTVTVTVTEDTENGGLKAEVAIPEGGIAFVNSYATETTSITLSGKKTLHAGGRGTYER